MKLADFPIEQTAIRTDLGAIFISMELSMRTWLVSSIQPGRQRLSKHVLKPGEIGPLLALFVKLQTEALTRNVTDIREQAGSRICGLHGAASVIFPRYTARSEPYGSAP